MSLLGFETTALCACKGGGRTVRQSNSLSGSPPGSPSVNHTRQTVSIRASPGFHLCRQPAEKKPEHPFSAGIFEILPAEGDTIFALPRAKQDRAHQFLDSSSRQYDHRNF